MRRADKPTFPAGKGSPDGRIKRRGGRCRLSVLLLFCVLLAGATCPACAGKPVKHTASFYAMDTVISVTLYTPDAELAGQQAMPPPSAQDSSAARASGRKPALTGCHSRCKSGLRLCFLSHILDKT